MDDVQNGSEFPAYEQEALVEAELSNENLTQRRKDFVAPLCEIILAGRNIPPKGPFRHTAI